jgi:hypothetical protein
MKDGLHQMFPMPQTQEKIKECEDYILITLFLGKIRMYIYSYDHMFVYIYMYVDYNKSFLY